MRPSPRVIIERAGTPAFLVTSLINIRYLTGAELSAGLILIRKGSMTLFVDGRYREVAAKVERKNLAVRDWSKLVKVLKNIDRCGCEAQDVTLARMKGWKRKFKNTKFVQKEEVIEHFRRQKASDELRSFRKAQKITNSIMERIPTVLKFGITERELSWKLREWVQELGADDLAFESIVAFGSNTSRPHHHPTNKKLCKRDIVQIDMGAKFGGYCADQSRVFFVGKPTDRQKQVYEAVEEAKKIASAAVRAGVTNHDLDQIARKSLKCHKLEKYFVHSLGHGVGLEIHEGVSLSKKAPKTKLLSGEIVTIEPGVYLPGKFGIRLEDEILVESGK